MAMEKIQSKSDVGKNTKTSNFRRDFQKRQIQKMGIHSDSLRIKRNLIAEQFRFKGVI